VAANFLLCDRDQELLLPPSLREWLPGDHLAWFVLDAVDELDLSAFYAAYREDGWGRAAFDPQMMVALVLYAYAVGERSSRGIERRCRDHLRVERRPPPAVPTIRPKERAQIHLLDGLQDKPDEVILRQPLTQARRQQQLLVTITEKEVRGHRSPPVENKDAP